MKTTFLRLLEAEDKAAAMKAAVATSAGSGGRFEVDSHDFSVIPRSPFAYWVSETIRNLFAQFPAFAGNGRIASSGGKTLDDFRWIRASWEVSPLSSGWVGFAKGGAYSPYYADIYLLLNWKDDARSLKEYVVQYRSSRRGGSPDWTAELSGSSHYLRPGLTWPRRTNGLSLRVMPAGCVFADKGPAAFVEGDDGDDLLALAAVANSRAFALLVSLQLARTELAQSFEVGLIQRTPIPPLQIAGRSILADLAKRAWSIKRRLDTRNETSHAFTMPALLQMPGATLLERAAAWAAHECALNAELIALQSSIDAQAFELYGIGDADIRSIAESLGGVSESVDESAETHGEGDLGGELDQDDDENEQITNPRGLAIDLISWVLGVAQGRFDIRVAARGVGASLEEPDPFARLPTCAPGILTGEDGFPSSEVPSGYLPEFPLQGILVEDRGQVGDLGAALRAVFDKLFGDASDAWWSEVASILDPKNADLVSWVSTNLFEYHLKKYSKSRRKAPIMWQFAVPSGRYSVWLYAHRLSRDSFIQIQNDVLTPKLTHEERRLTSAIHSAGGDPSAKDLREIEAQRALVEELRSMLDEVKRVAPLWRPSLDDGIILTMAPLWRLLPRHKGWQREVKAKWDDLIAGKYDWSDLAMHLWPERVVAKCAADRSLAIAHGLEVNFWHEGRDGKWDSYKNPKRSIDTLVRDRTSVAVKAALKSLLEAPDIVGPAKRAGKSRAA